MSCEIYRVYIIPEKNNSTDVLPPSTFYSETFDLYNIHLGSAP